MRYLLVIVLFIAIISCDDIIVQDISDDYVDLSYPVDSMSTTSKRIEFSWERMAGADSFRFQLISPSFYSSSAIALDTIVLSRAIELRLSANEYQWRVCGLNEEYQSKYGVHTLFVTNDN